MKLIFVYNADSGYLNAAVDAVHRIVSPETYPCDLCALTFSPIREREAWKRYRERSTQKMIFYHKDEFEEEYGRRFTYPLVLCEDDGRLMPLITKQELQQMETLDQLIDWLRPLQQEEVDACQPAAERIAGAARP